jgi:low affinity Fe/Cu permease
MINDAFRKAAQRTSHLAGTAWAFSAALLIVLVWGVSGPLFRFSDTWQLVINTGTTIVTFLMVFLIQNTQNRDSRALHMKLDQLILYTKGADNDLVDAEELSDEQMDQLEEQYHRLARVLGKNEAPAGAAEAQSDPEPALPRANNEASRRQRGATARAKSKAPP